MREVLRVFWRQMFGRNELARRRVHWKSSIARESEASATIFLVMRRMRVPLITLIVLFAVSVLGLTLIPGQGADGRPVRMGFFDSFYFMSYTATTIGFGELPQPFTSAQRLWVMATIYLTVIGWAYAIGSILTLLQDRAFRRALALRHFTRKVAGLREPFLLMAGYGRTGEVLGRSFDSLGQQFVVIDQSADRIDALELAAYRADVPGLVGDARDPRSLGIAGLDHPYCAGVLALTDDDEVNLAVTMAAALLRPGIPVIARTVSLPVTARMRAFGTPTVVNPFDRFGDQLRLALRSPASFQLMSWLQGGPGSAMPDRGRPPADGRWVMCGYGRFGRELTRDLRAEGLDVTILDTLEPGEEPDPDIFVGDASDPAMLDRARLSGAVGFVAGTDNDTTNLSLLAAARRINPDLFLAARQNQPASAPLFRAMEIDSLLVPAEFVANQVSAQLSTPLLWRFLQDMPARGDDWAQEQIARLETIGRLGATCTLPALWTTTIDGPQAPALRSWLSGPDRPLADLLRSPADRSAPLEIVVLMVQRDGLRTLAPGGGFQLATGDELLLAGRSDDRRALESTFSDAATAEYVLHDRTVPSSWVWRRLSRRRLTPAA